MTHPDAPLTKTPTLERLLAALRRRIVLHVWLHGFGTVAAAGCVWLLFAFFADWGLRVPGPVRVMHGFFFLGVIGFFAWRDLIRPLRRIPGRGELAVLLERTHPELRELLVSAAQFQSGERRDEEASPELIDEVLRDAEARAAALDLAGVLDERRPRARFAAGGIATAVLAVLGFANQEYARIFLDHIFGGRTPWPQRTHLAVSIPVHDASVQIEETPELIHVRVARGTDVPILVRAEGVVPDDVTLHFEGARNRILTPSGGGVFRTLLPCQEDLAFHVTGGDDDDGLPRVEIEVLQPPDVEGVAVKVEPPEWSGLAPSIAFNRDVEVVAGSKITVHMLPSPRNATGGARLLPEDRLVELSRAPYPRDDDDDVAQEQGLVFEFTASASLGYRFELVDDTGLANPDPGLFRVHVIDDRPPDLRVLAPGRTDYETVLGGLIPIRARAEDDFGLTAMSWSIRPHVAGADAEEEVAPVLAGEFAAEPLDDPGPAGRSRSLLGATRVEVDSLAPEGGELTLDQRFVLAVEATDNHQPEPGVGRSMPVRIRLISADELLRRMQDRLARARLDANRLADLQREKRRRVEELLDSIKSDSPLEAGDTLALNSAAVGQRRVQADATSLARDLAWVTQDVLYARLDDKAGGVLEFLDARLAASPEQGFQPGPWSEVGAAHAAGELGAPGFTGSLVGLVHLALQVSEGSAKDAAAAVDRAQKAGDASAIQDALVEAIELQTTSLRTIEDLLERLAEWDNFQNVLALTRDILNRQKTLRDRTKRFAKEKQ